MDYSHEIAAFNLVGCHDFWMSQFDAGLELWGCRSNIEYTLKVLYWADGMQMLMEL